MPGRFASEKVEQLIAACALTSDGNWNLNHGIIIYYHIPCTYFVPIQWRSQDLKVT